MKALVLSGGGVHGAFQAGVVKRLAELGHRWDLVAGVSVGAVNGLQVCQYGKDRQLEGARKLEEFWLQVRGNESMYRGWIGGLLASVTGRGSLYDTTPLREFLRSRFDPQSFVSSGVRFLVGATSLTTGEYRCVAPDKDSAISWAMASAAFPGAFPPEDVGGDVWVDGGVRCITPWEDAVEAGATELDVVLADARDNTAGAWDRKKAGNAVEVGLRVAGIMANEVFRGDLEGISSAGVKVNLYAPYGEWGTDPLDFNPQGIRKMLDVGYGIP